MWRAARPVAVVPLLMTTESLPPLESLAPASRVKSVTPEKVMASKAVPPLEPEMRVWPAPGLSRVRESDTAGGMGGEGGKEVAAGGAGGGEGGEGGAAAAV